MRRVLLAFWARGFFAALAVLVGAKLVLMGDNVFGGEAFTPWYNVVSKLPLLLGHDIVGAALAACAIWATCLPLLLARRHSAAVVFAGVLQAVHALLVAVSMYTTIHVGGPLNREVIELAFQSSDGGGAAGGQAMWSSISPYLGAGSVLVMLLFVVVAVNIHQMLPEMTAEISRQKRGVVGALLTVLAALGVLLLPWLINGHILGIRIHTYGLERSAGVELALSYARPVLRSLRGGKARLANEFRLDMSAIAPAPGGAPGNPLSRAVAKRTNVIVISLESVAAPYIDEKPALMPFLSSVANTSRGVMATRHYSVWPQTMKAFFSLFCSELPYPDYRPITVVNPSIPCASLSGVLKESGYHTAFVTSADLAYDRKLRFFRHRGFDSFTDMRNMPGRETVWGDSWGLDERLAVRNILALAKEKRRERFFVFYEMVTAHHPYNACEEHVRSPLDERPAYERALGFIDDRVRELVEGVAALGMADETLFAVVSDHGEGFGQHPGSRGHGAKVYDENVRVPFALIGPQLEGAAGGIRFVTSHLDVAPTILGLVGIAPPCSMKGRDLSATSEPRIALFGGRQPGAQKGVADGRWKYIREENGMELLFDVERDSAERENLVARNKELAARYGAKLDEWEVFSQNLIERYSEISARAGCVP